VSFFLIIFIPQCAVTVRHTDIWY